jgi:hypothetical protein
MLSIMSSPNCLDQALFFDVRKGASSIGSNVRDSACYFFWALARAQEIDTIKPFATSISQSLITLALFDKEVHIRLAASAAFQENVGRMVCSSFKFGSCLISSRVYFLMVSIY